MIVAGIGCRRLCPAEAIVAVVRHAERLAGVPVALLAAPAFKRDELGLHAAAAALGVPLRFVEAPALSAAQAASPTRSQAALRATGFASVAEASALAASGGRLLLPRTGSGPATCAIAG